MPAASSTFLDERRIMIAAGVAGLLFGLHPLHVESVAWVAERKDLLCGLFFLLSISAYANHVRGLLNEPLEKKKAASLFFRRPYLVSLVFFVLALLSKPMAVSLPVVLLILDWYPFQRISSWKSFRDSCVEKLPFVLGSLVLSILTIMAQRTEGATEILAFVPWWARMLVAAKAFVTYLGKIAAPVGLSSYYPYPKLQEIRLLSPQYLCAVILMVGITAILFIGARKQRLWLSAWGYYVVTLIPVIGIIQVGSQSMADRYTYLPSLGPFLLIGVIAAWVWAKADSLKQGGPMVKGFTTAVAISLVISVSYATLNRMAVWRDDVTLLTDMVKRSPAAPVPHYSLGTAYLKQNRLDEAVDEFITALKLEPDYADAHNNLGYAYLKQNRLDEAVNEFLSALKLKPDFADAHYNLGTAYLNEKRLDEAVVEFITALKLKPDYAEAHNNLGYAYLKQNRLDEAANEFNIALKLTPDFADAHYNLGFVYMSESRFDEALNEFNIVVELKPDNFMASKFIEFCSERIKTMKR